MSWSHYSQYQLVCHRSRWSLLFHSRGCLLSPTVERVRSWIRSTWLCKYQRVISVSWCQNFHIVLVSRRWWPSGTFGLQYTLLSARSGWLVHQLCDTPYIHGTGQVRGLSDKRTWYLAADQFAHQAWGRAVQVQHDQAWWCHRALEGIPSKSRCTIPCWRLVIADQICC